jgi:hypothetical protein
VPVGQSCADLNVTLDDSSTTVQLAVPQFRSSAADASATVTVSCDLNSVSSGGQFERRCMAVDNELDTRATCQQRVHVTGKPPTVTTLHRRLRFQSSPRSKIDAGWFDQVETASGGIELRRLT